MKKFYISNLCNACGICTTMTDLITEDSNGYAHPDDSKFIQDDYEQDAENIAKQCPVGAISIKDVSHTKSTGKQAISELAAVLEDRLKQIPKFKLDSSDFNFDATKYKLNPVFVPTNLDDTIDYKYSTKSAANNAAVSAFREYGYSRLDSMIRDVLGRYKIDVLSKYYTFDDSCPFVQNNKAFEKVLQEIYAEATSVGLQIPMSFTEFNVIPDKDNDSMWNILKAFEMYSMAFESVKDEFKHSESEYLKYIYIDYESRFVSSGFFGDKYENVYGYSSKDLQDAVDDFISDLNFCFSMADNQIAGYAYRETRSFVERYNILTEKEIQRKIEQFKKAAGGDLLPEN
jgi:ferredoxin